MKKKHFYIFYKSFLKNGFMFFKCFFCFKNFKNVSVLFNIVFFVPVKT